MIAILAALVGALCTLASSWELGGFAARRLLGRKEEAGRWFDRILLGMALLAMLGLSLAAVGLLRPLLLSLVASILTARVLWSWRMRPMPRGHWTWQDLPLLASGGLFVWFGIAAVLPPFRHDDLTYHLLLPRTYLEAGSLVSRVDLLYANMPHLTEVLFAWPMALGGLLAPAVLVLVFSAATLGRLWQLTSQWAGRLAASGLVLLLMSGRNIQWHLGPAHIEPVLGAYTLGAVLLLVAGRERGLRRGELVLLGVYLGYLAASKYTVWPLVALVGATACWLELRGRGLRPAVRTAVGLTLVAGLFVGPWMVKNVRTTGNPIYPNAYSTLGGSEWSGVQDLHGKRALEARAGGANPTPTDRLAVLWRLPFGDNHYNCPSAPIALMLLFYLAVGDAWRRPSALRFLAPLGMLGIALWASGFTNGRYLMPWMPILALATIPLLARLRQSRGAIPALLGITLATGAYQLVAQVPPPVFRGREFLDYPQPLLAGHPTWALCEALERRMPADGRLLALWENRLLCLDREMEVDGVYQAPRGLARLREADDPHRFAIELVRRGTTHVVIHAGHMQTYVEERYPWSLLDPEIYPRQQFERDLELLRRFVGEELELVEELGPWGIFEIQGEISPSTPPAPEAAAPSSRP